MKKKFLTIIIFQTVIILFIGVYFNIKNQELEMISKYQYEEIEELSTQLENVNAELEKCKAASNK